MLRYDKLNVLVWFHFLLGKSVRACVMVVNVDICNSCLLQYYSDNMETLRKALRPYVQYLKLLRHMLIVAFLRDIAKTKIYRHAISSRNSLDSIRLYFV